MACCCSWPAVRRAAAARPHRRPTSATTRRAMSPHDPAPAPEMRSTHNQSPTIIFVETRVTFTALFMSNVTTPTSSSLPTSSLLGRKENVCCLISPGIKHKSFGLLLLSFGAFGSTTTHWLYAWKSVSSKYLSLLLFFFYDYKTFGFGAKTSEPQKRTWLFKRTDSLLKRMGKGLPLLQKHTIWSDRRFFL